MGLKGPSRLLLAVLVVAGCVIMWNWLTIQTSSWPQTSEIYDKISNGVGNFYPGSGHDSQHTSPESSRVSAPASAESKKKIVMVTGSAGNSRMLGMPRIKEMVYENRITYAQKHGLDFMWANMTSYNLPDGAPVYWNKIPILRDAFDRFPEAEWIWWLDIDIIIMNISLHIHDHVLSPEGMARNILLDYPINGAEGGRTGYRTSPGYRHEDINFVLSLDHWGMNVGNFLMRRSEWSDWLLDMWLEPLYISQNWVFPENDGWSHLWQHHQIVRNHTACMNQHSMNAYPDYNALGSHWEAGDHVVHFAGCGGDPICEGAWAKHWSMREDVEVPAFVKDKLREGVAEIEAFQGGAK